MNAKSQRTCAIFGMLTPWLMFAAMLIGNFLPPLQPSLDAHSVNAFYQDNATRLRVGAPLMQVAGGAMIVFTAIVAAQLRRVESPSAPVLSYVQMGAGFVTAVPFILPAFDDHALLCGGTVCVERTVRFLVAGRRFCGVVRGDVRLFVEGDPSPGDRRKG